MDSASFLQDLAVVLLAAGAAALLFHRLRQPKVLGDILAGLLLGPHTPPFSLIQDETTIRVLADLGVIFLMFSLGLEFNLRRLRKVGTTAGVTALMDVTVMVWLGYLLGRRMGWSTVESLFLGGMICDSSTTILAKILQETGRTRERFAGIAIGITVVEDVLAVGMIAILTGVAMTGTLQAGMVAGRLWELILFLIVVAVAGLLTLPRLLDYVFRFDSDELLVVVLVGLCFGVTLIGARLQLSLAMGAVLVGAIASESRAIHRLGPLIEPLRYMFSAIFFVAVGLMLDPAVLVRHWLPLLAVTSVVVLGKFLTNTLGSLLTGQDMPTSVRVGAGMAQIGEFAFIIAALGLSLGATSSPVYQVGVAASVLTTLLNAYLMRGADRLALALDRSPACRRWTSVFQLYGQWVERIGRRKKDNVIRRAVRRSVVTILVNTVLICAAIVAAGYLARRPLALVPALAERPGLLAAALWLAAMLLCLPMYVAIVRKLQALGMILSELGLPSTTQTLWARNMRSFVANAILVAGSVGLALMTFILSSTMLPSNEVLILLMCGTAAVAFWRWPKLVKVYAQAQSSLEGMLKVEGGPDGVPPPAMERPGERGLDLEIESAVIPGDAAVAGQALRAIHLRRRTGATVVGIRRAGRTITNPGPDERLENGDCVFLLGNPEQIATVRALLTASGAGS